MTSGVPTAHPPPLCTPLPTPPTGVHWTATTMAVYAQAKPGTWFVEKRNSPSQATVTAQRMRSHGLKATARGNVIYFKEQTDD